MAKDRSQNVATIRKILKSEGWSNTAIAGALARMRQESNFNPLAVNKNDAGPGKHSYGLFQWNRERFAGLQREAKRLGLDWRSVEAQARWFAKEAKTTERTYGRRLMNAKTPEEAAAAAISMARPQGWTPKNPRGGHGWGNTLAWTKNLGVASSEPLTLHARDEKAGKATPGVGALEVLAMGDDLAHTGATGAGNLSAEERAARGQRLAEENVLKLKESIDFFKNAPELNQPGSGTAELMSVDQQSTQMAQQLVKELLRPSLDANGQSTVQDVESDWPIGEVPGDGSLAAGNWGEGEPDGLGDAGEGGGGAEIDDSPMGVFGQIMTGFSAAMKKENDKHQPGKINFEGSGMFASEMNRGIRQSPSISSILASIRP